VLDRYLEALGGVQRLAGITSFVATGTQIGFDDADTVPMDMYARAPGQQTTIVHTLYGDRTTVVDGRSAWVAAPDAEKPVPLLTFTGLELEGVNLEAQLLFPARIKELLTDVRVGWPILIDDREVQPVQGVTPGGVVVTLCFDTETGLLNRFVRVWASPVGPLRSQLDFSNYRAVSGVQMPFQWTVTWLGGRSHYVVTEVEPNVTIEEARFARPAPSVPPR
jgi:outer membrane lipoprotein-sorting protein